MRKLKITLFVILILSPISASTIWFWPNIVGQYRFQQYCAREGGLKIYGEVLPDQGWLAASSDPDSYKAPFRFKRVAFVRYQDKQGKWFDVYIKRNPWPRDSEYLFKPVDKTLSVKYQFQTEYLDLPHQLRLSKTRYMIHSIQEKRSLIELIWFGYSSFDQNKTILSAPSGSLCPDDDSPEKFYGILN